MICHKEKGIVCCSANQLPRMVPTMCCIEPVSLIRGLMSIGSDSVDTRGAEIVSTSDFTAVDDASRR